MSERLPWINIIAFASSRPQEVATLAQVNRYLATIIRKEPVIWRTLAVYRYGESIVEASINLYGRNNWKALLQDDNRRGTWVNVPLTVPPPPRTWGPGHVVARSSTLGVIAIKYHREKKLLRLYIKGQPDPELFEIDDFDFEQNTPSFSLERLDSYAGATQCIMIQFEYRRLDDVYYQGIGPSFREMVKPNHSNQEGGNHDQKCRAFEIYVGSLDHLCNHPLAINLFFENEEFELFRLPAGGMVEDGFRTAAAASSSSTTFKLLPPLPTQRPAASFLYSLYDDKKETSGGHGGLLKSQEQAVQDSRHTKEALAENGWRVLS